MGLIDTKPVDSTANVINEIESKNIDTDLTNILLSIIVSKVKTIIIKICFKIKIKYKICICMQ